MFLVTWHTERIQGKPCAGSLGFISPWLIFPYYTGRIVLKEELAGCSVGKVAEKRKIKSLRRTQVRGRELLYKRGVDGRVIIEGEEECTRGRVPIVQ